MDLAQFRIINHEFLNKDKNVVLEQAPFLILDIKSALYMAGNGKDTKQKTHFQKNALCRKW